MSPCLHERPFDECRVTEYEVRGNGGNNRNEKVLALFTGKLIDEPGVTADLLIRNGFHVVDVEDL